ncbi:hypothetical protein ElyMa_001791800 [Elysia marginata]|uniref:Secreted protein n=1 Tax=Elysia marginata TaxID=1093978 RepID=A0AAV4EFS7_9GAST|nr:hypothetical protein ElyMa_001791800 [Elysia marginata]
MMMMMMMMMRRRRRRRRRRDEDDDEVQGTPLDADGDSHDLCNVLSQDSEPEITERTASGWDESGTSRVPGIAPTRANRIFVSIE